MNKSIKTYSLGQIDDFLQKIGQPAFRKKQLIEWLYVHPASSYEQMTNLPKALREKLGQEAALTTFQIADRQISSDGTRKYLFRLYDGELVETVGIPSTSDHRLTVCFSTQVGCAMGCRFCATGKQGFTRNLGMGEIIDQILAVQSDMGERVSNLVGMGQGEPFLNYEHVSDALRTLNDPKGLAIGARKITVSTCGIIPGIDKFAQEPYQYTMAVSLHSANQTKRNELMPFTAKYPLAELKKHLRRYIQATNRRITFEYLLIKGINDGRNDLHELIDFCDGLLCHVNFLHMNPIENSPFQPSSKAVISEWIASCEHHGIAATERKSRGADINGACGQLRNIYPGQ